MHQNYIKEQQQMSTELYYDKPSFWFVKIFFEYVGYNNQNKTITINANSNTLNINLEQAIFKMDEVISSTTFNKLQSKRNESRACHHQRTTAKWYSNLN
jgi:hypothetical protein